MAIRKIWQPLLFKVHWTEKNMLKCLEVPLCTPPINQASSFLVYHMPCPWSDKFFLITYFNYSNCTVCVNASNKVHLRDKLWTTGFLFKDRANVRTVQPSYSVQHFNMWSFNSHRTLESAKASGITQSDVLVLRWDHFLTRKAILTCSKFLILSTYKTFYLLPIKCSFRNTY